MAAAGLTRKRCSARDAGEEDEAGIAAANLALDDADLLGLDLIGVRGEDGLDRVR